MRPIAPHAAGNGVGEPAADHYGRAPNVGDWGRERGELPPPNLAPGSFGFRGLFAFHTRVASSRVVVVSCARRARRTPCIPRSSRDRHLDAPHLSPPVHVAGSHGVAVRSRRRFRRPVRGFARERVSDVCCPPIQALSTRMVRRPSRRLRASLHARRRQCADIRVLRRSAVPGARYRARASPYAGCPRAGHGRRHPRLRNRRTPTRGRSSLRTLRLRTCRSASSRRQRLRVHAIFEDPRSSREGLICPFPDPLSPSSPVPEKGTGTVPMG